MNEQIKPELLGIHRIGLSHADTDADIDSEIRAMLYRALNIGNVIAFTGSGLSYNFEGFPSQGDCMKIRYRPVS